MLHLLWHSFLWVCSSCLSNKKNEMSPFSQMIQHSTAVLHISTGLFFLIFNYCIDGCLSRPAAVPWSAQIRAGALLLLHCHAAGRRTRKTLCGGQEFPAVFVTGQHSQAGAQGASHTHTHTHHQHHTLVICKMRLQRVFFF